MVRSIALSLIVLLGVSGCSHAKDSVNGRWRYVGAVGESLAVECPDILVLEAADSYYVLNDCYGVDAANPITEHGAWKLDENPYGLVLYKRSFKGNYHLINANSALEFKILKLDYKELILSVGLDGELDERYERL